uniref:Uncharacterized protein n=1 Tax=Triticum urartu TaxID=4572 RepID=A0A8R7R1L2_TRIUA
GRGGAIFHTISTPPPRRFPIAEGQQNRSLYPCGRELAPVALYEEKRSSRRRDPIQRKRRRRLVQARPQLHAGAWSLPRALQARGLFLSCPILTSPIGRI